MNKKPLILIVDDEAAFREIISAKLTAAGFDCAVAKNGLEAIQKAPEILPNLILMDVKMPPGLNGIETALSIKENPKTKDTNIIFLTSTDNPWPGMTGDNQMISKELGMQGFFDKGDLDAPVAKLKDVFFGVSRPGN